MDEFISKSDVIAILYELKDIPHLNAGYVQDAIRKIRMLPDVSKRPCSPEVIRKYICHHPDVSPEAEKDFANQYNKINLQKNQ